MILLHLGRFWSACTHSVQYASVLYVASDSVAFVVCAHFPLLSSGVWNAVTVCIFYMSRLRQMKFRTLVNMHTRCTQFLGWEFYVFVLPCAYIFFSVLVLVCCLSSSFSLSLMLFFFLSLPFPSSPFPYNISFGIYFLGRLIRCTYAKKSMNEFSSMPLYQQREANAISFTQLQHLSNGEMIYTEQELTLQMFARL